MDIAYFTKTLQGMALDRAAETTAALGFDCIDLLIRDGHAVTPDRPDGIASAVSTFASQGLRTAMATIDATRADQTSAALLSACRDAGVSLVRLGFWRFDPARPLQELVDEAQHDLDGFERFAEQLGIKLMIQLHGGSIHSSGAQTAQLLIGRDPKLIGAYPDPGNQAVQEGSENWRQTLAILDPWFCCMGVKNGGWSAGAFRPSGQREWRAEWCALDEGMVPWDDIIPHLVASDFAGPLSLHSHYRIPQDQALAKVRADLVYLRKLIAQARET